MDSTSLKTPSPKHMKDEVWDLCTKYIYIYIYIYIYRYYTPHLVQALAPTSSCSGSKCNLASPGFKFWVFSWGAADLLTPPKVEQLKAFKTCCTPHQKTGMAFVLGGSSCSTSSAWAAAQAQATAGASDEAQGLACFEATAIWTSFSWDQSGVQLSLGFIGSACCYIYIYILQWLGLC